MAASRKGGKRAQPPRRVSFVEATMVTPDRAPAGLAVASVGALLQSRYLDEVKAVTGGLRRSQRGGWVSPAPARGSSLYVCGMK